MSLYRVTIENVDAKTERKVGFNLDSNTVTDWESLGAGFAILLQGLVAQEDEFMDAQEDEQTPEDDPTSD